MKQCEIWYADLNPVKVKEQWGFSPMVIISGNVLNDYTGIVIACPLTTKIKGYKGDIVLVPDKFNGLSGTSEVLIFHIRSISKELLMKKIGQITKEQLKELKQGLNDLLKY